MSTFFTSDLHLGHVAAAKFRGFKDVEEHDLAVVKNINSLVNKRDKLFILGDLIFSDNGWKMFSMINCRTTELILGNHDKYPIPKYLKYVTKIHGFRRYNDFWLSHCPIHPNELYRCKGNLHGHVHHSSNSERILDTRYMNVNIDMNNMHPVPFDLIQERFIETQA